MEFQDFFLAGALVGFGFFLASGVKGLGGVFSIRARTASRELSGGLDMTDSESEAAEAKPEPFSMASIAFDTAKLIRPSIAQLVPEEFIIGLGMVAVAWGDFETSFDDFIAALVKTATANVHPSWKVSSFRKRRILAAREINRLFVGRPAVLNYLRGILADSERLQRNRNLLVHGSMSVQITTGAPVNGKIPGTVTYICAGTHRGQAITVGFTASQMHDVYYGIAHLAGRLNAVCQNVDGTGFSLPDRSFLQGFLDRDYRKTPKPTTPSHQP